MKVIFSLLFLFIYSANYFANVKLASLFTDNMVLQRDKAVNVWGKADEGEMVRISINDQTQEVIADKDGSWKVKFLPMNAGGPFELTAEGKNKITIHNVMIGEVWLCSGQSNMEFTLAKSEAAEDEIKNADFPMIRIFIVKHHVADSPLADCNGTWVLCSPKTIPQFSAAAYYFGKELHKELNVPIGLIQSTWGGTAAECWMEKEILAGDEDFKPILSRWDETICNYPNETENFKQNLPALTQKWMEDSVKAVAESRALPRKPAAPDGPGSRNTPTGLFNGMIAPLIPFTIQGVIWYQGEANAKRAFQYRKLFPALITSWREKWGQGDFPFYFVQLPNLNREPEPSKSGWTELREAQLKTLSLSNTGMAVTIDIGDPNDLHPKNKKDVGHRLALIAKALTYKMNVEFSGPIFKSMKTEGSKIRISLDHTANGLVAKGSGKLSGFTICGDNKNFVKAEAVIDGNDVLVWNNNLKDPLQVRYAWADDPDCNLYNSAMLPASPFRTDDWPEVTFTMK